MTDHRAIVAEARRVLADQQQRADHRKIGELVRYPRLVGDQHVPTVATITQITCITPALPYSDRTLEFALQGADGRRDRIRVSVGYRGLVPVDTAQAEDDL
jgi:hypothetical protein